MRGRRLCENTICTSNNPVKGGENFKSFNNMWKRQLYFAFSTSSFDAPPPLEQNMQPAQFLSLSPPAPVEVLNIHFFQVHIFPE